MSFVQKKHILINLYRVQKISIIDLLNTYIKDRNERGVGVFAAVHKNVLASKKLRLTLTMK